MTTLSEKIMKTNLNILSKEEILKVCKKQINPAEALQSLIAALPDVFLKEPIEPENLKRHLPPNPADVFVQISPLQKPNKPVDKVPRKKIFIQKSPFTNSGYSTDPALRVWYYIDETDRIQGPFTSLEMDHWFDSGFFFNELLVRFKEQNDFVKLLDLFGKTEQPQNYRIIPQEKNDHQHQKPKLVDVNIWEKIKPMSNQKEENIQVEEKNIAQEPILKPQPIKENVQTSSKQNISEKPVAQPNKVKEEKVSQGTQLKSIT
jgi:hypothetical protein